MKEITNYLQDNIYVLKVGLITYFSNSGRRNHHFPKMFLDLLSSYVRRAPFVRSYMVTPFLYVQHEH